MIWQWARWFFRRYVWVAVVDGSSRLKLLVVTLLVSSCRYGGSRSTPAKLHSNCLRNVPKETMNPFGNRICSMFKLGLSIDEDCADIEADIEMPELVEEDAKGIKMEEVD
ncbi:hypothetical protein MKX03_026567 [Papaver bracteatum]|nr:hypothetical protein MKX03_026567 [Papaver bracteatum]